MLQIRTFVKQKNKQLIMAAYSTSTNASRTNSEYSETKVKVGEFDINYLKVGNGSHNVVCLPGALGTIWTDFKPQIEGFNREKFTLYVWDPPGHGKSRPPEKEYSADFYEKDSQYLSEFMKKLSIPRYSILGWSDGGITGLIQAARNPSSVDKLVVFGTNAFILPHEIDLYKKTRDIKQWSPRMRQPMIDIYGEETFAKLWAQWCDGVEAQFHANKGDICMKLLKDIKCSTFVLYGEKDPMVDAVHAAHLHTNVDKARLHLYPDGKHNIHLKYAEDFNRRVQEFLLEP